MRSPRSSAMTLQPGALVGLRSRPDATYQVLTIDPVADNLWVRRWPLRRGPNPSFSAPLTDVQVSEVPLQSIGGLIR